MAGISSTGLPHRSRGRFRLLARCGPAAHHETHQRLASALTTDANAAGRCLIAGKETGLCVLQRVAELSIYRIRRVIPGAGASLFLESLVQPLAGARCSGPASLLASVPSLAVTDSNRSSHSGAAMEQAWVRSGARADSPMPTTVSKNAYRSSVTRRRPC